MADDMRDDYSPEVRLWSRRLWSALMAEHVERAQRAAAADDFYVRLGNEGKLRSHVVVTYRCRGKHCALARVLRTPDGLIVRRSKYKLTPRLNAAESSPEGRAKNAADGDRRWPAETYFLSDVRGVEVLCDHVREWLDPDVIRGDVAERHAEVLLPR